MSRSHDECLFCDVFGMYFGTKKFMQDHNRKIHNQQENKNLIKSNSWNFSAAKEGPSMAAFVKNNLAA